MERTIGKGARCGVLVLALLLALIASVALMSKSANAIELSNGETITSDEEESFTVTAPAKGYVYFEITVLNDGYLWSEIWSDTNSIRYGILKAKDKNKPVTSHRATAMQGEKISLRVTDAYDDVRYSVKAVSVAVPNFEDEPNDNRETANELKLNSTRIGMADEFDASDDYFVHTAAENGSYTVWLRPLDSEYDDIEFQVYREEEKLGYTYADSGSGWNSLDSIYLKSGQKLFAVVPGTYNRPMYEIKLTFTPSKTSSNTTAKPKAVALKSVKAKKKSFVAKWAKGKGIDGYQIWYSTSKSFSGKTLKQKVASSSKTKLTVKKLKSKTTYYVKVRAYKKGSKVTYSSWSRTRAVQVK